MAVVIQMPVAIIMSVHSLANVNQGKQTVRLFLDSLEVDVAACICNLAT